MREIKFRAWDVESKKMYPPFGFKDLYGYEGECNAINVEPTGADDYKNHFTLVTHDSGPRDGAISIMYPQFRTDNGIDPNLELMQFTGLKDKNSKEIYEGDIVKRDSFIFEVWFKKGSYIMTRTTKKGKNIDASLREFVEIIGNIHENPDLLTH